MSDMANINKSVTVLNNKIINNYCDGFYCKNKRSFIKMSTKTIKLSGMAAILNFYTMKSESHTDIHYLFVYMTYSI